MKQRHGTKPTNPSRRTLLAAAVVGLATRPATATVKASKASVGFREHPAGDHRCGNCAQFVQPDDCRYVAGTVSADCCCKIWTGKAA